MLTIDLAVLEAVAHKAQPCSSPVAARSNGVAGCSSRSSVADNTTPPPAPAPQAALCSSPVAACSNGVAPCSSRSSVAGIQAQRLGRFAALCLLPQVAQDLAQRLDHRDADLDHRTLCAECTALVGRPGRWKCNNYRRAALNSPDLPGAFVTSMLQACPGHMPAIRADN